LIAANRRSKITMKGIIYCRVSSKEQIEGTSLDSQRLACEEYAHAKHIEIAKVFIELGESAKFADRTQLLELIEFCRQHKGTINTLLVWKVDRFARNVADHFGIKAALAQYGVDIVSVTEPIDAKPEGKLMETILAGFAQFDNDIRTMRSVQGMRRKIHEGIFPWNAPIGYKSPRVGREKKNRPDEPDQPLFELLQRAWQEFATGTYTKAEIKRLMATWGITTKRGEPLPNQSIDNLFQNSFYAGILTDPWSGEDFRGLHVPMVSPETFARVQQIISKRGRSIPHQKLRIEFPLRGFARCPECLGYLTGSFSRGRSKVYPYYHCHDANCSRRGKGISVSDLDNEFKTFLLGVAPRPDNLGRLNRMITDQAHAREILIESRQVHVRETGEGLDRALQELIRMRTQHLIDDDEFQSQRKAILQRRQTISAPIDVIPKAFDAQHRLRDISKPLQSSLPVWEDMGISTKSRFQRIILPFGFPAGKVRTAERALLFRLEDVFADEDDDDVPFTLSRWNQLEKEISELWELLSGHGEGEDSLPTAA
jgi:site-specific DNA recombinase